MTDEVLTRDVSSGRIHKRAMMGGRLLVDERCNLDQAGAYEVIQSVDIIDVPTALCGHCFPPEPEVQP